MKALAFCCAIFASSFELGEASPLYQDIYVYGDGINVNYQCAQKFTYDESDGQHIVYAARCVISAMDSNVWPVFTPAKLSLSISGADIDVYSDKCQWVSNANTNGNSSTVVDCRGFLSEDKE